ncbi:FAD-binding oxidoreductase [Burkholderia multivorans]|uniref:FAD-binding oxidoreductase n=1 Tax=Burkholderia multivorans TaxID=87883 RepID=UPI0021BE9299|nr:FAD-binding oxidoreductase [Burkholderia multivorans]MDN7743894.1 FAD-binding oxidoreductase [Burkholderia multivorans]MDR8763237.1 4-cresol dehydrogenase (hydroxylating) flavoprotein subunit [Burkholderia multivorans]MDR8767862.1 4-cresol dehydrogenase (hydroxylating) flavoprotein subunit [Burkholderia multivorans]MDR8772174.1 4-cresol dehydrogenase (hydroxylating) flavoprotein subunit [Burkholderia multivorans]MDR8792123.1 4-cresol dehydrogenase (hydroxylating) flavoprotein subunit [Burkh
MMNAAIQAWRTTLGVEWVRDDVQTIERYAQDTSDYARHAVAIVLPSNTLQVQEVVRIASTYRVPIHPVSTGRNWGYGTANPPRGGCAIVDLSRMCEIRAFDADLGLVTLEPGVTQRALRAWMDERHLPFMVPTTGAGPECSIVGNALERGYGITPVADHFAAVTALEAVLPDGSMYRSPMADKEGAGAFKWGVGPYLDGIFTQGHVGIVTGMTVALARRPACVEAFYFWIDAESKLESAVEATRRLLQEAGANIGGINLMSAARVLAMSGRYRHADDISNGSDADAVALARRMGVTPWMGIGAIYGTCLHARATRHVVRRTLDGVATRIVFMTPAKAALLDRLARCLPGARARRFAEMVDVMKQGLSLLEGVPGEVALPLAYRYAEAPPVHDRHPSRDGCGLLWYAPIVPLRGKDARRFVDLARDMCSRHGFDAPITLTSVSERSFDCTLPLLFDRTDAGACKAARECWDELLSVGRQSGFLPYRVHIRNTSSIVDETQGFWAVAGKIKAALDPLNILSPGRWESVAERCRHATHTIEME